MRNEKWLLINGHMGHFFGIALADYASMLAIVLSRFS